MRSAAEKSSVEQIRQRFDQDVDRFSDLNAGQVTAIDGALCLDLIAQGVAALHPDAAAMLDIGCGAGNWTLKILQRVPRLSCTLLDLSRPMLDRARERVSQAGASHVDCVQGDVRSVDFPEGSFDFLVAGAVLHHLRTPDEWRQVAALFFRWLKPGGSLWVYDLVSHEGPAVEAMMKARHADYLRGIGGEAFVQKVFDYIDEEDSPWPVTFQLKTLVDAGFSGGDILHKNGPMAANMARK
ncbi:MAG: class I SAM-dependent methyltransferase [Tepidisphaeraceae bacterium]